MLAEKQGLAKTDLKPLIGSVVRCDAEALLSGRYAQEIRALLEERGVLLFPQVNFTDEQQGAFTRTLGVQANEYNGETDENGAPRQVYEVRLRPEEKGSRSGRNTFLWHLDGSMSPTPILASLLSAKQIAASGGETEFCSTYAAYEALPEEDKAALEGLKVVHANWWLQRNLNPEPTYEDFLKSRSGPSRAQPLVWKHRSGRKSLVLGSTAAYVVGMDPADSMELLVRLRDWATQPQFVYRHEWTAGDLVMWDNTGTMHRALPYEAASGRLLHRTMLQGEEAFA